MEEVDLWLSGRARNIRLKGRLRDLYRERTFNQSSLIVRSWMGSLLALDVMGSVLNFALLERDVAIQALMPSLIIFIGALSVSIVYRGQRISYLQDAALIAAMFVILLSLALFGVLAGPAFYERYCAVMIFVAISAIVIFSIPLAMTWSIAAIALLIHAGMMFSNPLMDALTAATMALFFGAGVIATVFARRTASVIAQKSFLLALRDLKRVSDLADANTRLELLARTDALTGVANRRWMTETLDALWSDDAVSRRVAILMCDVDHFKGLNDALGHLEGDQCLREVAHVIRDCIRPGIDHVARYGGEEFLVLLSDVDAFDARLAAERICRTMEAALLPNPGSGVSRYVTVSIGICTNDTNPPVSAERLQRHADEALYLAKSRGRNRVVAYEEATAAAGSLRLTSYLSERSAAG
ncbi:hypothetical protein ASG43_04655 [Aureimonas sp. Leaf454]|nr:hypothetical protein ASG43_04655 [Aureimonas sp. Leaf454]